MSSSQLRGMSTTNQLRSCINTGCSPRKVPVLGESGGEATRKMRVLADLTIDSLNIGGTLKRASTRKMRMENPHVKRSRMVISTFK